LTAEAAAAAASLAASTAVAAAEAASAAELAAASTAGGGVTTTAGAGAGGVTTTGVSSFLLQALIATAANRVANRSDFFMGVLKKTSEVIVWVAGLRNKLPLIGKTRHEARRFAESSLKL
jgi:hypothetical protein